MLLGFNVLSLLGARVVDILLVLQSLDLLKLLLPSMLFFATKLNIDFDKINFGMSKNNKC